MKTTMTKLYKTIHLLPLSTKKLTGSFIKYWESLPTVVLRIVNWRQSYTRTTRRSELQQLWPISDCNSEMQNHYLENARHLSSLWRNLTFLGYLKQLKSNHRIPVGLPKQKLDCSIWTYFLFLETVPFSKRQNTKFDFHLLLCTVRHKNIATSNREVWIAQFIFLLKPFTNTTLRKRILLFTVALFFSGSYTAP